MQIIVKAIQITPRNLGIDSLVTDYSNNQYKITSKDETTVTLTKLEARRFFARPASNGEVIFCEGQDIVIN